MTEFDTGLLDWRKETGRRAQQAGRAPHIDPLSCIWPRHPKPDWHQRLGANIATLFEGQKAEIR